MNRQMATITVIGKDKTGVIAKVTDFLFNASANIEALEEQVTRGQFSMTILASWSLAGWQEARIRTGINRLASQISMEISLRSHPRSGLQKIAIMVTKEHHCLEAILEELRKKRLKATPVVIISNRKDLAPIAKAAGVPFAHIPWQDRQKSENAALALIEKYGADLVVLARFMKILSPNFVWRHKNKIINIHPSLLPSFPGPQAYRQAYEHGVKVAGVTAHFVSMHLDEGPIIAQESFAIKPTMTLKDIVTEGQRLETKALLRAIKLYLNNRLDVKWGTVELA